MSVKRYSIAWSNSHSEHMQESDTGDYTRFEDYQALERYKSDLEDTISQCATALGVKGADALIAKVKALEAELNQVKAENELMKEDARTRLIAAESALRE